MQFVGLSPLEIAFALLAVFVAAIIRGYTGFGFSALCVASLTFIMPPAQAVPIILLLEVAASLGLLRSVWSSVDWRAIAWLMLGTALGAPLGVYFLIVMPEIVMRAVISIAILTAALALLRGLKPDLGEGPIPPLGTGIVSGLANGVGAVGGLPVVLLFLAKSTHAAVIRASVVVLFLLSDIYVSALNWGAGVLDGLVFQRFSLFLIPLAIGVAIGSRQFTKQSPETFRNIALFLLIGLSSAGLVRIIYELLMLG